MQTLRAAGRLAMILGAAIPALSGCGVDESPSDDVTAVSGALTVVTGEYHEPAQVHDRYIAPWETETWAKVWRPQFSGTQRYPLLVMLHGNHHSCRNNTTHVDDNDDYATTGACPGGYSVVKSHEGYDYLGNDLASRGYIVVSINAHLGFPVLSSDPSDDPARLRARGRLVLWHLKRLSEWNRGISPTPVGVGASLQNRIDFSQVGFMGHSRGGPSVRSALADYRTAPPGGWPTDIPNMTVRGVVEIASSDVPPETFPIADDNNLPWLGLVGLCDAGMVPFEVGKVFDRLLLDGSESSAFFKGLYGIYGANHNYFNSQWLVNDAAGGCRNQTALGASSQRASSLTAVGNFFRATVGASRDTTLARIFDPVNAAPSGPTVSRAFTGSPSFGSSARLEEFNAPDGFNSNGIANDAVGLTSYQHYSGRLEHDDTFFLARVGWQGASSGKFLQSNWAPLNSGWDLRGFRYLEFRVDPEPGNGITTAADFSIQLVNANNTRSSALFSSTYVSLPPLPATLQAGEPNVFYEHPTMKTVRIPLTAFANINLASVRGVRFVFNRASQGLLWMSAIRAVKL